MYIEGKLEYTKAGTVPITETAPRITWMTYGESLNKKLTRKKERT